MKIIDFNLITTSHPYERAYGGENVWSRGYEYPIVLSMIKDVHREGDLIHNSSWGFSELHLKFKGVVDRLFTNAWHSDIKPSLIENTFVYDITKPPSEEESEKYDILMNVSTLEEVNHDHLLVFQNLFQQIKPGGYFIATFDLLKKPQGFLSSVFKKRRRVLQLAKFEELFGRPISINGTPLDGANSQSVNLKYSHLNCGLMVVQKDH